MNQLPAVPALGLTLAIPRDKVDQALKVQISKGYSLIRQKVSTREAIENLKKMNWNWVLETSNILKECFFGESVALHFSSNVYIQISMKLDDLERDLDEFPATVGGRIERLQGLQKMLAVIPEPPCGDFLRAQFHPRIYRATWRPFELAQYGIAVAAAVQELEDAIKEAVRGSITTTGVELVEQAFEPDGGPLSDKEGTAADNQGVRDLFVGFMYRYKGLPASCVFEIDAVARVMSLSSYLMYLVDRRCPQVEKEPVEFEFLKDDGSF